MRRPVTPGQRRCAGSDAGARISPPGGWKKKQHPRSIARGRSSVTRGAPEARRRAVRATPCRSSSMPARCPCARPPAAPRASSLHPPRRKPAGRTGLSISCCAGRPSPRPSPARGRGGASRKGRGAAFPPSCGGAGLLLSPPLEGGPKTPWRFRGGASFGAAEAFLAAGRVCSSRTERVGAACAPAPKTRRRFRARPPGAG